ncbi:MAG: hypothetical protein K5829_12655 [Treponema sp.]|nr:hypothetical protein [Treponema sp.]
MKKGVVLSVLGAAICGLFIGCASTGSNEAFVSSVEHPRTYVIDIADAKAGNVTKFSCPNGSYFGGTGMDFSDFLKYDPPRVGDTFEVHYKGVSDIDISGIELCISNHSTWNNLISQEQCAKSFHDDIKAGVPFEGVKTYVLDGTAPSAKAAISFDFYYDNCLMNEKAYARVGKSANITWEKTGVETTNTALDSGEVVTRPEGPVDFVVEVSDVAKLLQFDVGDADASGNVINFKTITTITDAEAFKYYLPKKGDTVTVSYNGTSDADITGPITLTVVDNSEAAGWWKEICAGDDEWKTWGEEAIVAGQEFTVKQTFTVTSDAVGGVAIIAIYPAEGATGALWKFIRK